MSTPPPVPSDSTSDLDTARPPNADAAQMEERRTPWTRRKAGPVAMTISIVIALLLIGVIVLDRISVPYLEISPGTAQPVSGIVSVPASMDHHASGTVLYTDVSLQQLNALTYFLAGFDRTSDVIPSAEALPPGSDVSQLGAQGYVDMAQSQDNARIASLRALHDPVTPMPIGGLLYAYDNRGVVAGKLSVGDLITAVNATDTPTDCALGRALSAIGANQHISLTVRTASIGGDGTITYAKSHQVAVTSGSTQSQISVDSQACPGGSGTGLDRLGITSIQTRVRAITPTHITFNLENVGGPSAGLAMTLGVIDALSPGKITGLKTVAVTGTIDADGNVGDVGGVRQKTIAIERAGATLFLVPPQEYAVALAQAQPGLKVFAVSTLDQALAILGAQH